MPKGDIGSIIETKDIVSNNLTLTYNCIKLSNGYYMMAYRDNDSDGHIVTFALNESDGNIGSTISDWEFLHGDTTNSVKLIKVSGTTYAIIYSASQTIGEFRVATFTVSDVGVITTSFIESLTIPTTNDEPTEPVADIINISGNIYAIVFTESGAAKPGVVVTVDIDSAGVIGNTVIDSLNFTSVSEESVSIIQVGDTDYWAIAYENSARDPTVVTVDIDSSGAIAAAVTATQVLAATNAHNTGNIMRVPGTDYYALPVGHPTLSGTIYTVSINSSGAITNGSNGEFDSADAEGCRMISLGGDAFLIAYRGVDNDGFLVSITIDSAGAVGSVIESLEFKTSDVVTPLIIYLGFGNYAVTYGAVSEDDVECVTVGVATGIVYPSDAVARVSSIRHIFQPGSFRMQLGIGAVGLDVDVADTAALLVAKWEEEMKRTIDDVRSYGIIPTPGQARAERPSPIGLGPLGQAARDEQIFKAPTKPVGLGPLGRAAREEQMFIAPQPTISERATQFTFPGFTAPAQPTISDKVTEQRPVTLVQPGILDKMMRMFRQRKPRRVGITKAIRDLMRFR